MKKKGSFLLFALLWLTVSCDLANSFNRSPTAENTAAPEPNDTAVTVSTPSPETTPDIAIPTTAVTETRPSLRVWIPPEIALSTEEGAAILNAQLAAYRSNHPDIDLTVEQKSVSGQGGILNYLRTGRTVAPLFCPILSPSPQTSLALP